MIDHHGSVATVGDPVTAARTTVPTPPDRFVDRPRLTDQLDTAATSPVTLVAAPAGWGKTVLLSSWTRAAGRPVAWLSIELGDDRSFWSHVSASLRASATLPSVERPTPPVGPPPPGGALLVRLAAALMRLPEPLTLVIDNAHHLREPTVLQGVDFLLRHAAGQLRLVIGTRAEPALPLHRWRLSGDLAELRAADLSFTVAETAQLLARHGLALPDDRVAELTRHTEGWPAGLRLAALTTRPYADGVVADFTGDEPYVADYLAGEVLAQQPAELREVLVSTSILDWVGGGLVNALTGRTDGERLLAGLVHGNVFLFPRGTRPPTYRYHAIFGEFLRGELRRRPNPDRQDLHRRAAGWLAENGYPADALPHALAAQDWQPATSLFTTHWRELVCHRHSRNPGGLPAPPPAAVVSADPELALAYAVLCLQSSELATARSQLQQASRHRWRLTGARRDRFGLMAAALELALAQAGAAPGRVLAAATGLLARTRPPGGGDAPDHEPPGGGVAADHEPPGGGAAPEPPGDPGARAIAFGALGCAQFDAGELELADASLTAGLGGAAPTSLGCLVAICTSRLALVRALRGQLRSAVRVARAAVDLPPCPGQLPATHCAHAHLARAIVDMHWDRLADAESPLELATARCDPAADPDLAALVAAVRARLRHYQGDLAGAYVAVVAASRELAEWPLSPHARQRLAVTEAEVRTACGDPGLVRETLAPWLADTGPGRADVWVALARSYLRADDPGEAVRCLPAWDGDRATATPLAVRIDAGLLEALAARRLGQRGRSGWALERVLRLAEPEGFRQPFTGADPAIHDLLASHLDAGTAYWPWLRDLVGGRAAAAVSSGYPRAVGAGPGLAGPGPAGPGLAGRRPDEPLTDRELTILRYLQSILSTGEIAGELHLSVNTVKTHLRNIYRKLGTTRRREAVRRGRELHLL